MTQPLLIQLVNALTILPGVGKKTAQRMAFNLLEKNRQDAVNLGELIVKAMQQINNCNQCRNYTEALLCEICANNKRDSKFLCIVESPSDIPIMESTAAFSGKYFVLMGALSPLDGVGPDEIGMPQLRNLLKTEDLEEIIIATSSTVEGDATAHYIKSEVSKINPQITVSKLAQGVPIGGELEFLDSSTLSLSLANRQSF